jgi:hypothetical protein
MKFCKFKDPRTSEDVYINPASVRMVKKNEFSAGSSVVFEDGSAAPVQGTLEEVASLLEEALGG